jgi:hypothetical protein
MVSGIAKRAHVNFLARKAGKIALRRSRQNGVFSSEN